MRQETRKKKGACVSVGKGSESDIRANMTAGSRK